MADNRPQGGMMIHFEQDKFKEECGVFGIYSKTRLDVATLTYYGLYALQHRGQESAGIAVAEGEELDACKGMGLVRDIFDPKTLEGLGGHAAIGHVRYSTSGESRLENAQPLLSRSKLGPVAIAHNGTLVNANVIRELLEDAGVLFLTSSDSEVILNLIARNAAKGNEQAIISAIQAIKGSYAVVILTKDQLIGIRDPNGIRPLCIGRIGEDYLLASESCALDAVGAELVRDVAPGEMVVIGKDGIRSVQFAEKTRCMTCAFEYIYFARPDSRMDGIGVYGARVAAGKVLAREAPAPADVVIGVPDSGVPAAIGYAQASGIPFGIGFIKNRYVGRTFITPSQEIRENAVSVKLNVLKVNVEGKRVVLIDDSIVRGTTSRRLVQILRKAGAREIHFRIASPMVKYPCYFGIDTPYRRDLLAARMSEREIGEHIGADSLAYLSEAGLLETLGQGHGFCLGCLNGEYPVDTPIENRNQPVEGE